MHGFLLQDLAAVMLIAGFATILCHRLKQPVALGYIVAGVILGPYTPVEFVHDEDTVRALRPNHHLLRQLPVRGIIATARANPSNSNHYDFVSRFFAPGSGVDEDPVTGSAHCALAPYWAARIGKPSASRAVGMANGSNPVAIVVPCHRVIGANGSLTGYGGGIERKRWLLEHESKAQEQLALAYIPNSFAAYSGRRR